VKSYDVVYTKKTITILIKIDHMLQKYCQPGWRKMSSILVALRKVGNLAKMASKSTGVIPTVNYSVLAAIHES